MARRDVDLVIRARDEAKNALDSITRTIDKFTGAQRETQDEARRTDTQLDKLGAALAELQTNLKGLTAGGTVANELERARSAFKRVEDATQRAAGEAIGYRREAQAAARATAQLRTESERVVGSVKAQEAAVKQAQNAQRQLEGATRRNSDAQRRYAEAQERVTRQIAEQNLNLANYRNRFRELQGAITGVAQPTATMSREFSRTAANIERTQAKIADLTETQRLIAAETDRANRSIERSQDLYGAQAQSLQRVTTALAGLKTQQRAVSDSLQAATREQNRLEASADKAAVALRNQDAALDRAKASYESIQGVVRETEGALSELEQRARGPLLRAFGQQRAALLATEQAFQANSAEAQRLARELRQTEAPTRELQDAFEAYRQSAARGRQEVREQQRALAELRAILRETGGDVDTFADRQNRFAGVIQRAARSFDEYERLSRGAATANERLVRAQERATGSTTRLTGATRNLGRATAQATRNQGLFADAIRRSYGETRTALSFTQRLRGEVLSLLAAYGGFFAAIEGIRGVVNAFQTLEAAQNRLNVVFQGDELAINRELDFIRRTAERLGIEFGVLAQEYTKFTIATQGTNLEGAETRRIFVAVAEAARVNNLTMDQLQGTFVALTQIVSKGSVSMEELRQQLGDRLPGALQIMAAGLNLTTAELIDMIEQGDISSDALSNFADELDRRFSDSLPEALETTNAALGRFQNAVFQTLLAVGRGGAIRGFTDLLNDLTETLQSAQFQDFAARVGAALESIFGVIGAVVDNFDLLIVAITTLIGLKVAPFVVALVSVLGRMPAVIRLTRIRLNGMRATLAATTGSLAATTGAVGRLRVALRLLLSSTGIGLLVTLIGTGIGLWVTRTTEATEALSRHQDILDQVRNAYDETGASVEEWRQELSRLTVTQATANLEGLQQQLRNLQQSFRDAIPRNILGGAVNAGGGFFREVDALFQQFRNAEIGADEFLSRLDELNQTYRDMFPVNSRFADQFDEIAREIRDTAERMAQAQDVVIALTGDADEAEAALRRLGGGVEEVNRATQEGVSDLDRWRDAIRELREQVPSLASDIEDLDERAELENAYQAALRLARTYGQVLEAFNLYRRALEDFDTREFLENIGGAGGGAAGIAGQIIRQFEGFRETPYFDVNALRIGYGSDTVTLSDGSVRAVTEGMRVTREEADRDLVRRITQEFLPAAREAIGPSRFDSLSPQQQAVLASLGYNYGAGEFRPGGDLQGVVDAVQQGSAAGVAQAIRDLGAGGQEGDVGQALINRRNREAALFEQGGDVDLSGAVAAEEERARLAEERAEAARREQEATAATLADQQFQIAQQELINAGREREAAIQEAIRAARAENAAITEEELAQVAEQAGRLFDLQNAERIANAERERALALEERVNELLQLRQQLQSELDTAQQNGASEEATDRIRNQLQGVNDELRRAVEQALQLAIAMGSSDPAILALISRLRELQLQGADTGNQIRITFEQLRDTLANSMVNAANTFAQSLAEGKSVTESLRDAFLQFAADFLRQIAQMILQQLALNAAKAVLGFFGFGAGSAIVVHSGGVVGQRGTARTVDSMAFMNAVRMHSGGIAGLAPGEVPAILQRNEEVLTTNDPRHIFNGGGGGQQPAAGTRVKIVNALDGGQVISEGLNTSAGEEAIMNFIRSNGPAVRAAIES